MMGTTVLQYSTGPSPGSVLLVILVLWLLPAVLVYFHAKSRTNDPALWAIVALVGGLLGVLVYLAVLSFGSSSGGNNIVCLQCDAVNNWSADFCRECGAVLRVVCPNCRHHQLAGNGFCTTCGTDLANARPPDRDTGHGTDRQHDHAGPGGGGNRSVVCPECDTENEWSADYCARCGGTLRLVCPDCGTHELASHSFCQQCGTDLSQASLPDDGRTNAGRGPRDQDPSQGF